MHGIPRAPISKSPPYFEDLHSELPETHELKGHARSCALWRFGDHRPYLSSRGFSAQIRLPENISFRSGYREEDFNSYGSRRGNHHVMMRGTFANVRIRNKMAEGKEGGFTKLCPRARSCRSLMPAKSMPRKNVPLIIFAGKDYGMGSSRDWAAKGTALLGVRAVVAQSFERIHRSNLIGMGVLPLEFKNDESFESLGIKGDETFSILGIDGKLSTGQEATLEITRQGKVDQAKVIVRLDTPIEIEYYLHGGIMPYVLRKILKK